MRLLNPSGDLYPALALSYLLSLPQQDHQPSKFTSRVSSDTVWFESISLFLWGIIKKGNYSLIGQTQHLSRSYLQKRKTLSDRTKSTKLSMKSQRSATMSTSTMIIKKFRQLSQGVCARSDFRPS